LHQLEICEGFVDTIQILPLDVFDKRELESFAIRGTSNDDRHLFESNFFRRTKAALARNEL